MPYGQILEIMVALVLLAGAPEKPPGHMGVTEVVILWPLKAILWYLACRTALGGRHGSGRFSRIELWEWAALLPLVADIYFLGAGNLFSRISTYFGLESLREILGMLLFFFYLAIVWSAGIRHEGRAKVLSKTVSPRLRLLLPIILPYFILIISFDLLKKLPFAWVQKLLASEYSSSFFFLLFIFFFLFLLPPLVIRLWKCVPLPPSDLRDRIEKVLDKQGITFSNIMLWTTGETMACTAAVMGIIPGFRYILLTPCLIRYLLPEEIEAVIAHEIEHVRRRHVLWYVILLAGYSAVLYRLADPFMTWLLSTPQTMKLILFMDEMPGPLASLLAALPFGIFIILYFRFIMGYFMRNFERQADMAAFKIHGHPFFMIDALKKVALLSGIDPIRPNWHHFSIRERINFLKTAYNNPGLLEKQNYRLRLSTGIFLVITISLLVLPSALPTKAWKNQAHANLLQLYYEELVQHDEKNPRLYMLLGEVAFEHKRYKESELAYKKALQIEPENPEALNNLAWLYIKSEDPGFRRPRQALLLAMEAARIKPAPFILDTLAECLFQNGYAEQAVNTEMEAVRKAVKNKTYYLRQLKRFKKVAENPRHQ